MFFAVGFMMITITARMVLLVKNAYAYDYNIFAYLKKIEIELALGVPDSAKAFLLF